MLSSSSRYSVNDVAALARHASMSTSYKPALIKALVRLARRGCGDELSLRTIGAEFVSLFWVQTVVFRLRQSATVSAEPEAVPRIRSAAELNAVRSLEDLPPNARKRLDAEMGRVLTINVLDLFHKSKPLGMPPLYGWSKGMTSISLTQPARTFLTDNAHALEAIANLWWAKWLERVNLLTPLVIDKVERDGAKRTSLASFLRILQQTDEAACFYCSRPFEPLERAIHVDHVIPWSFMLTDALWNLVLACSELISRNPIRCRRAGISIGSSRAGRDVRG